MEPSEPGPSGLCQDKKKRGIATDNESENVKRLKMGGAINIAEIKDEEMQELISDEDFVLLDEEICKRECQPEDVEEVSETVESLHSPGSGASNEHGKIEGENGGLLNKTETAPCPQPRKYERKEIYCPFTWNECCDNLKANSLMMKLEEKLSPEEDSQWLRFCYHILLLCMHIKRKEEEKAIEVLNSSSEILLNNRYENFFKEIIPGFEHVLFSCELFMYVEKGDNEKARSIFSSIKSFHVLNQMCQAATLAVKASVLLLFGTKAQQESLRCINEAIELDPDEFGIRKGAWYCLAAKIHAEIRNTQGYNMMPSFEERQLAERSVLKNPFPIHYVYLADIYRQIAKMLLQQSFKDNKEDAEGMSKKAKKMYEDAINDENASMRTLTRSGMGLIKLPKHLRNVGLARIAFDRVLKMDPDHKSALIGMGNLLNWCLSDYKEALKYFEKACINHPVGRSVIQMKSLIDENYNPVEDCDKFIEREKDMNLGREQLTLFYEVVKAEYFLVKRKNIMEAARHWEKAVTSGPSAKEVWEYQCLFATNKRSKFSRMIVDEINLALKQRMEREDVEYFKRILRLNSSSQESTEAERK